MYQMSTQTALILLFCFYGLTFLVSLTLARKEENVDGYMVSNNSIGFGMAAASMTATWIWAASFYAAATSGYKYGLSGALHYGFWGALMIFFIYPFGKRFRQVAPKAHTLAEIMHARHGRSSQMIMAGSNIVGSLISLTVNFTAAGALLEILSPLSFIHGVVIAGVGVLSYTIWSGFRSSVTTDFGQVVAMIFAAVVIIPIIFFQLGGSELFDKGMLNISAEQSSFYSQTAILEQGASLFCCGSCLRNRKPDHSSTFVRSERRPAQAHIRNGNDWLCVHSDWARYAWFSRFTGRYRSSRWCI